MVGCSLSCDFCDTDNTISNELSIQEVKNLILNEIVENNIDLLVITGGEPLLQFDEISKLLSLLNSDINVQFETN